MKIVLYFSYTPESKNEMRMIHTSFSKWLEPKPKRKFKDNYC
jgi:hypothetical protein